MSYLLDTNVVSELRKRSANPHVLAWYDSVESRQLHLSVLTLGEIRRGVEQVRRKDPAKADLLEDWLRRMRAHYSDRIVGVDADVADAWGRMSAAGPPPVIDGLLAATAAVRNWTFVTRNVADVARCDVRTLNPFEPARLRVTGRRGGSRPCGRRGGLVSRSSCRGGSGPRGRGPARRPGAGSARSGPGPRPPGRTGRPGRTRP